MIKEKLKKAWIIIFLFMSCKGKYPFSLGGKYVIDYDGIGYNCILDTNKIIVVNSHIIGYNIDSAFIIVEQKPLELFNKTISPNIDLDVYKKRFNEYSTRLYYIINKSKDKIYGPYNKEEYFKIRDSIGLPQNFKIEPVRN